VTKVLPALDQEGPYYYCVMSWQHGHRLRRRARDRARLMRRVVMELATWRSGRIGSAAGSEAAG
jgi:hypothetical protein